MFVFVSFFISILVISWDFYHLIGLDGFFRSAVPAPKKIRSLNRPVHTSSDEWSHKLDNTGIIGTQHSGLGPWMKLYEWTAERSHVLSQIKAAFVNICEWNLDKEGLGAWASASKEPLTMWRKDYETSLESTKIPCYCRTLGSISVIYEIRWVRTNCLHITECLRNSLRNANKRLRGDQSVI